MLSPVVQETTPSTTQHPTCALVKGGLGVACLCGMHVMGCVSEGEDISLYHEEHPPSLYHKFNTQVAQALETETTSGWGGPCLSAYAAHGAICCVWTRCQ